MSSSGPVRPCARRAPLAVALAAVALAAATSAAAARASEGALAVKPGDTIRGTLQRCLDRQVSEIALARGEVFTMRVRTTAADNESIVLRVYDPSGFDVGLETRVRQVGKDIVAGPFRVPVSGTWSFQISTPTAHGAEYEAKTTLRRPRVRDVAVTARKGAVVAVSAGATLRLRGAPDATFALRRPGELRSEVLAPGAPAALALRGDGLAAARGGNYELALVTGRGRARLRIVPPAASGDTVEFPALPTDPNTVATWQGVAGWVVDPTRTAPDEKGDQPPPAPPAPATSPFTGSLLDEGPAPGEAPSEPALADPGDWPGPDSGVGLPVAGVPRLDEVVAGGRLDPSSAVPTYVLTRRSDALGDVTTRVWFTVEGRPSLAPLAFDGRVGMRWEDTGGTQNLQGSWALRLDPVRGVQVLDGGEGRSPDGVRTVTSAATAFALATRPGAWPQGRLSLAFRDPRLAADFVRTEVYDGGPAVTVDVALPDGSHDTAVHAFP